MGNKTLVNAVKTTELCKRHGATWALRDCTITVPTGSITGLVGPNGAGKSTLLKQIVGLNSPTDGTIEVLGMTPSSQTMFIKDIGYLAQDIPLYVDMTARELSTMGAQMNAHWDKGLYEEHLANLDIPLNKPTGKLSGGQRAQVALALALAKRPRLLVLDEPVAALDPLARDEFLAMITHAVTDSDGTLTVILSSHLLGDLEKICDHLILLTNADVRLSDDVDNILASHHILTGPLQTTAQQTEYQVILETNTERQTTCLVRLADPSVPQGKWQVQQPDLEEIVLGYMKQSQTHRNTLKGELS